MYRVLIVDDEEPARDLLKSYAEKRKELELVGVSSNALEAKEIIDSEDVDILLTDIQMDDLTGIDLLKNLKNPPITIFTTAFSEYALEGYDLDVIDYLVKPISFQRFCKAIDKASELLHYSEKPSNTSNEGEPSSFFFVKTNKKILKVNYDDVLFVESYGEYVKINTKDDIILALQTMGTMEDVLPSSGFVRIHRSHIVNLNAISEVEGNMVKLDNHVLTISKRMREAFMERLKGMGLV